MVIKLNKGLTNITLVLTFRPISKSATYAVYKFWNILASVTKYWQNYHLDCTTRGRLVKEIIWLQLLY